MFWKLQRIKFHEEIWNLFSKRNQPIKKKLLSIGKIVIQFNPRVDFSDLFRSSESKKKTVFYKIIKLQH